MAVKVTSLWMQLMHCIFVLFVRMYPMLWAEFLAHVILKNTIHHTRRVDFASWLYVTAFMNFFYPSHLHIRDLTEHNNYSIKWKIFVVVSNAIRVAINWIEIRFMWFLISALLNHMGYLDYNMVTHHIQSQPVVFQLHLMGFIAVLISITITDLRSDDYLLLNTYKMLVFMSIYRKSNEPEEEDKIARKVTKNVRPKTVVRKRSEKVN